MVRQTFDDAKSTELKILARAAPKPDPAKPLIEALLTDDLTALRK